MAAPDERKMHIVIENINREIIEDPTGVAREARLAEAGTERRAESRAQRVTAGRAEAVGFRPGAGPVGRRMEGGELETLATREKSIEVTRAHSMETRKAAMTNQLYSASLLQVNMSLLGVMFGTMNVMAAINAQRDAELQLLQMKENKTKADKERIKTMRKEQIEEQKRLKYFLMLISVVQMLASVMQILAVVKTMNTAASAADAQMSATNAAAKTAEGHAAMYAASGHTASWIAKYGPLGFVIAASILAATAVAFFAYQAFKVKGAAGGAYQKAVPGGELYQIGEGRHAEIVAPEPMLKTIVLNQTRQALQETGGGRAIIVYTMDAQSFIERRSDIEEQVALAGW